MPTANQELAIRWFDQLWNKGNRETIDELLDPEVVLHECGTDTKGKEAFHSYFGRMHASFSDFEMTIHDAVGEGDTVCLRWSCKMRHSGPGLGVPATGTHVETTGISIMRVENGKFVEGWQNWDMLAVLEAVGIRDKGKNSLATSAGASLS